MVRGTMLAFAAVLIACTGCSAARPEPAINAGEWAVASDTTMQDFSYDLAAHSLDHSHHEVPFTLLTKFIIRPSIAKEFVGGWLKFREAALNATGAKTVSLSKPLSDNLLFYSYEEWESKKDFFEFVKEEDSAAKKLIKYIEEKDIPVVLTQLVPAVPYHKKHHGGKHASIKLHSAASTSIEAVNELLGDVTESLQDFVLPRDEKTTEVAPLKLRKDDRKGVVIILTKFLVKPSKIECFVEAVDKVTEEVAKHEKGNVVYGLSKPLDDDVTFYAYAVWEDKEAIKEHLESSYAKKLLEFILESDIYTKTSLLLPIEKLDE